MLSKVLQTIAKDLPVDLAIISAGLAVAHVIKAIVM